MISLFLLTHQVQHCQSKAFLLHMMHELFSKKLIRCKWYQQGFEHWTDPFISTFRVTRVLNFIVRHDTLLSLIWNQFAWIITPASTVCSVPPISVKTNLWGISHFLFPCFRLSTINRLWGEAARWRGLCVPRITESKLCGRDNAPLVTLVATLKYES